LSLLQKAKVLTIFYYGFKEFMVIMRNGQKKAHEGLKRQTLKIISTLPWLNTAANAGNKQRLELLQGDGDPSHEVEKKPGKKQVP